jgi:ribosomal protein S12 methylthiotransferase
MKQNPKICKYIDIPFQHISDNVLKLMRRGNNKAQTLELIHSLRQQIPGIAIRTTLLVGHPGETEEDFLALLDFVRENRFERLGVFPYSHEEHSYAFDHYKDDIPDEVKNYRADTLMQLQQQISEELNREKIGKTFRVIVDRKEGDFWIGRTEFDSPEVDNEVLIPSTSKLKEGNFYEVLIKDANEYDLIGEIA